MTFKGRELVIGKTGINDKQVAHSIWYMIDIAEANY